MSVSAFKAAKIPLLVIGLSAIISGSVLLLLMLFYQSTARELIESWYNSEAFNIQQGNVLSAVTKLQRTAAKSRIIKGVIAVDESGRILAQIGGVDFDPAELEASSPEPFTEIRAGIFRTKFLVSSPRVKVIIETQASILIYVTIALIVYFIAVLLLFGIVFRRILVAQEQHKAELALNTVSQRLAISEAVSSVATQVAHDIRSPLTAIDIVVKSLSDIPSDKRTLLKSASSRINDIADDLLKTYNQNAELAVSFLGAKKAEISSELKPVVISAMLKGIGAEKAAALEGKSEVRFRLDVMHPAEAVCSVNEKELCRAISNLINNAIEACEGVPGGLVTLALRPSGRDEVAIIISDSGRGIPEEVLVKLGKERVTAGKEGTASGTGIGVLHAARTIEVMGGRFQIQSKVGVGTTITIRLATDVLQVRVPNKPA